MFPGEVWVVAAEVYESSSLLIDGSLQVKLLNDVARSEIEVCSHNPDNVGFGAATLDCAVCLNVEGERVGQANCVGDLKEGSIAEASSNQRLGHVAGVVCRRSINLSWVLAREGTTSMSSPATICVDDNFTASEPCISSGTTDIKLAGGVNHNLRSLKHVLRNYSLDDLLSKSLLDYLVGDFRVVLS